MTSRPYTDPVNDPQEDLGWPGASPWYWRAVFWVLDRISEKVGKA